MSNSDHRRYAGWAALATALLGLLGLLFLVLFFAVEGQQAAQDAGQGIFRFYPFGFLSDLPLRAVPAVVLIVFFYRWQRPGAPRLSLLAALLGSTGHLGVAVAGILISFHDLTGVTTISVAQQALTAIVCWGPLGIWLVLVNVQARRRGLLPARLTWLGLLAGVGEAGALAAFILTGGLGSAGSVRDAGFMSSVPAQVALGTGSLAELVGIVWMIWLGRVFLRKEFRAERRSSYNIA